MNDRIVDRSKDNDSPFRTRALSDILGTLDNDGALPTFEQCMDRPAVAGDGRHDLLLLISKRMKEKRAALDGVTAELRRIIGQPVKAVEQVLAA
jgi:hypothetical protein